MKVKLKKVDEKAQLPKKGKVGDLCYDVWAVSEEEVAPNVWRYGLGFKYEIERGPIRFDTVFFGNGRDRNGVGNLDVFLDSKFSISIDFRPRSGIWKTGMVLCNSEGTLDEFYRGEAMAMFYHVMPNMPRYKVGDRVGQIKLGFALPAEFEFVDEINEDTERGDSGFGSTGLK